MICDHCQQEQAKSNGLCEACLEIEPDMAPIAPTEEQMKVMADEPVKREETHYAKHHAQGCR